MEVSSRVSRSEELYKIACEKIPWGTQTGAKHPLLLNAYRGVLPLYIQRGKGSHVWDVDGNEYVDYRCALGPIILGYSYPTVDEAVGRQLEEGIVFSMAHPLEMELAKTLTEVIPCAEMVRFLKTGGDATSATVRVARAYTGREKVVSCGYHGWHDVFMANQPRDRKGVPKVLREYVIGLEYNDLAAAEEIIEKKGGEIACIIINPFEGTMPKDDFLGKLKALAHRNGILLVFDEVKTGFRLALGGAQEYFGVTPDLAAFSKAMANGYPISAFVGKKEIMRVMELDQSAEENVCITTTFAGETFSIAAALATIDELRRRNVYDHLWNVGNALMDGLRDLTKKYGIEGAVSGLPPWFYFSIPEKTGSTMFYRELLKRGIFCLGDWNLCFSHSEADVGLTLQAANESFKALQQRA